MRAAMIDNVGCIRLVCCRACFAGYAGSLNSERVITIGYRRVLVGSPLYVYLF